ncbi:MAG: GNAT family N-acetyltransferase [Tepidisphaeraceae bacterium]
MWREEEISVEAIRPDVAAGAFFLAWCGDEPVGTLKCLVEDPLFWPEAGGDEALYLHRLAVRRAHAGMGLSQAMLRWAVAQAQRSVSVSNHDPRSDRSGGGRCRRGTAPAVRGRDRRRATACDLPT